MFINDLNEKFINYKIVERDLQLQHKVCLCLTSFENVMNLLFRTYFKRGPNYEPPLESLSRYEWVFLTSLEKPLFLNLLNLAASRNVILYAVGLLYRL